MKIVSLAKTFWGSVVSDDVPNRAVAGAIKRTARASGARIETQSATVADNLALERLSLDGAAPYSVVRARFYMALFLMLPLGLMIAASWQMTLFALEIIPNELVRAMAALALVGATLLSIHLLFESLKRSSWVMLVLTALSVLVLAEAHFKLAKTRAAVIADWILQGGNTVVESATGAPTTQADPSSLTTTLMPLLEALLPLIAVGLEIMAGVTLYFVLSAVIDPTLLAYWRVARLNRRAARLRAKATVASDLAERADDEAQLAIDLGKHTKAFITKDALIAIIIVLVALLALTTNLFAAPTLDSKSACKTENQRVAMLIDLSKSRAAVDVTADAVGVSRVLAEAQGCSHYVVLGVGDDGWGAPIVLLDMKVTTSGGWMQQDLKNARTRLLATWAQANPMLVPTYSGSDVIGTMLYAIELLGLAPGRPGTLINFTDGRQTRHINLEINAPSPEMAVRRVKELGLVANIAGSKAFFLGASTTGKSPAYWNALRDFWKGWTALTGASLAGYSIGRDVCGMTTLCTSGIARTNAARTPPPPVSAPAPLVTAVARRPPVDATAPSAGGNRHADHECQSLAGSIGSSLQWSSGWLELDSLADFRRGDVVRLRIGGSARRVVIRFLSRGADPNSPDGVDGGSLDVPTSGTLDLTLERDHLATRQISVHGGVRPWGLYLLGGGNGPAVLLSAERTCAQ